MATAGLGAVRRVMTRVAPAQDQKPGEKKPDGDKKPEKPDGDE